MYNDIICEHFMNPRNVGELADADYMVEIGNPICGDTVHMYLKVDGGTITDVRYRAYGCSGSIATASIISEKVVGQPMDKLTAITRAEVEEWLGELEPAQMHCVDIGVNLLEQCASPSELPQVRKDYLVEDEGVFDK